MSPKMAKRIILNNSSTLRSLNTDASANGRLAEKRTNVNNAKGVKRVAMRDDTLSTRKRLCNKIIEPTPERLPIPKEQYVENKRR